MTYWQNGVVMYERMAIDGQKTSQAFHDDMVFHRDNGHISAANHCARYAAIYAAAARENLFAVIGQNKIAD